jgi:hypothetical protein
MHIENGLLVYEGIEYSYPQELAHFLSSIKGLKLEIAGKMAENIWRLVQRWRKLHDLLGEAPSVDRAIIKMKGRLQEALTSMELDIKALASNQNLINRLKAMRFRVRS